MIGTRIHPVTQVRTGHGAGQCTEAAIASLVGCRLEDVPDLWAGPHVPDDAPPDAHQPHENRVRLWNWLEREHGVKLCGVKLNQAYESLPGAWDRACELFPLWVETEKWAAYHLMVGPNPDGVSHYVVARRGVFAWDPNPSRRGIVACQEVEWLVPLHLVPEEARELPGATWLEAAP